MVWLTFGYSSRDDVEPVLSRFVQPQPFIQVIVNQLRSLVQSANAAQAAAHKSKDAATIIIAQRIDCVVSPIDDERIHLQPPAAIIARIVEDVRVMQRTRKLKLQ